MIRANTRRSPAGHAAHGLQRHAASRPANYIVYHGITDGSGPQSPIWNVQQAAITLKGGGTRYIARASSQRLRVAPTGGRIADHVRAAEPGPGHAMIYARNDDYPQLAGDLRPAGRNADDDVRPVTRRRNPRPALRAGVTDVEARSVVVFGDDQLRGG